MKTTASMEYIILILRGLWIISAKNPNSITITRNISGYATLK